MQRRFLFIGLMALTIIAPVSPAQAALPFPIQSLDGSGNNVGHPDWGQSGRPYLRVAPARYADGISRPVTGPNSRYVSNRVFNDVHQNVFSEHRVTQWGFVWGQFLDHTFGLRLGRSPGDPAGETANIPFNAADPVEEFTSTLGYIPLVRSTAADGLSPRQQVNTNSSYVDAFAVYGGTSDRLAWLRDGSRMFLPGNYLPRRNSRGDPATAPVMEIDGRLRANPDRAMVAGDVRANENVALTATHTLFAREHNRIVASLPSTLSTEDRFQIARRILIAEQQYITYNEFLPAMGVPLPAYAGYKPGVNATLGNEFATVGYRAHSQIHGELEMETDVDRYTQAQLDAFEAQGIEVAVDGDEVELAVPLNVAFFNPDLVPSLQLGPILQGIGLEPQYNNEEQIDNQLRSVLFQVPVPGNPSCLDGPTLPQCFKGVVDLGAIDIERGRDHGMPSYNQLRQAFGLPAKTSFTSVTGEATEAFPPGLGIDNPASLDFVQLSDIDGGPIPIGEDGATKSVRRTTTAARLKAIYGTVNNMDAFSGMVAEKHLPGAEFGELQLAIWARQFAALRDGDRFFYGNDPGLTALKSTYGLDYRVSLAEVISRNSDIEPDELNTNVFLVQNDDLPAAACTVAYRFSTEHWPNGLQVAIDITNNRTTPINGWTLRWEFASGQAVTQLWNGNVSQTGNRVTVTNASWNATLPPGFTLSQVGFNGTWDNATDPVPPNFTLNNLRCAGPAQ